MKKRRARAQKIMDEEFDMMTKQEAYDYAIMIAKIDHEQEIERIGGLDLIQLRTLLHKKNEEIYS